MNRALVHHASNYCSIGALPPLNLGMESERLTVLCEFLKDVSETILKCDTIFEIEVIEGYPLYRLLYEKTDYLSDDQQRALQLAVDRAKTVTEAELDDVRHLGTVGLRPSTLNEYYTGDKAEWRLFRRAELRVHVKDAEEFVRSCEYAFPSLKLSSSFPSCLDTFEGGFGHYHGHVTECFAALNDDLRNAEGPNTTAILNAFAATCGYDTSMEGNVARRPQLTFDFVDEKVSVRWLCEPHMKLSQSDRPGDTHYYQHRIYFSSNPPDHFAGMVMVGHAGKHL